MKRQFVLALLAGLCPVVMTDFAFSQSKKSLPEDYKQILPRGRIAAITNPGFVSAQQAEIRDESWVLGVVVEGKPRAYSLALLNSHEVVNDRIGSTEFAAVW